MGVVTSYSATPIGQAMIKALIGTHDDAAMAAVRADFWQSRLDHTRVMLDRAVARGGLAPLAGPIGPLEMCTQFTCLEADFRRVLVIDGRRHADR
jgi:hypothetical protein